MRFIAACAIALLMTGCGGNSISSPSSQTASITPLPPSGPLVFMGDSITAFWSVQDFFPGARNGGVGGQTTAQMLARFDQDVLSLHPSVVIILGGTNDIRLTGSDDPSSLFAMVQKAEAFGAKVIVGTLPPNESWLTPETCSYCTVFITRDEGLALYAKFNDEIRQGALIYGYKVADYYRAMINPDGSQNASLFDSSLVHPNAQGYVVMVDVLRPVLEVAQQP